MKTHSLILAVGLALAAFFHAVSAADCRCSCCKATTTTDLIDGGIDLTTARITSIEQEPAYTILSNGERLVLEGITNVEVSTYGISDRWHVFVAYTFEKRNRRSESRYFHFDDKRAALRFAREIMSKMMLGY